VIAAEGAPAALDVTDETVVQYEGEKAPKRATWRAARAPAAKRAPAAAKFSWNYVKSQLGQSVFALIQNWNSGKPLSGELQYSL